MRFASLQTMGCHYISIVMGVLLQGWSWEVIHANIRVAFDPIQTQRRNLEINYNKLKCTKDSIHLRIILVKASVGWLHQPLRVDLAIVVVFSCLEL